MLDCIVIIVKEEYEVGERVRFVVGWLECEKVIIFVLRRLFFDRWFLFEYNEEFFGGFVVCRCLGFILECLI